MPSDTGDVKGTIGESEALPSGTKLYAVAPAPWAAARHCNISSASPVSDG